MNQLEFLDEPTQHGFIPWPERQHGPCFVCNRDEDEHVVRLDDRERRLAEFRQRERFGRPGLQP